MLNVIIYCLRETRNGRATGFYKVGRTVQICGRIKDLQAGNPRTLELATFAEFPVWEGSRREHAAHNFLSTFRGKEGGTEWFKMNRSQFETFRNWLLSQ